MANSAYTFAGISGYSGYSGIGTSGYSGFTGQSGSSVYGRTYFFNETNSDQSPYETITLIPGGISLNEDIAASTFWY